MDNDCIYRWSRRLSLADGAMLASTFLNLRLALFHRSIDSL